MYCRVPFVSNCSTDDPVVIKNFRPRYNTWFRVVCVLLGGESAGETRRLLHRVPKAGKGEGRVQDDERWGKLQTVSSVSECENLESARYIHECLSKQTFMTAS